jgi:hypothetical protein
MIDFDVSNVVNEFLKHNTPERRELIKEFREEVIRNPAMRRLVAEVGQEAVHNQADPVMCIGLGLLYGMVLGVFLERDRQERGRRAN